MYYSEDKIKFFENYEELKKKNPNVSLKDCMSSDMISDIELDKSNVMRTSEEEYKLKKFNYNSLSENKKLSELSETEFEFRYPNYLLDYDFEFAESNLKNAIINFLNEHLIKFLNNPNFNKIIKIIEKF